MRARRFVEATVAPAGGKLQKGRAMPVWASNDTKMDLNKDGVQRRHIDPDCPVFKAIPVADQCASKGRPNTDKFQDRTARCEHAKCQALWDEVDAAAANGKKKRSKSSGGSKISATKAATQPAQKVGGKAADLAAKAKAMRQKPASQPVAAAA